MGAQFTIGAEEGFYLTVAEDVTVYEEYTAAVAEIQAKLDADSEGFLAEVTVERADDDEDVAVTLEQVAWQRIIRDLPARDDGAADSAGGDGASAGSTDSATATSPGGDGA